MTGNRTQLAPYERFPDGETMVEMRARAEHFWQVNGSRRHIRFMNSLAHLDGLPEHLGH